MAKEMGLDRAPIEFQTFYFSHVLVVPPSPYVSLHGAFLQERRSGPGGLDRVGLGAGDGGADHRQLLPRPLQTHQRLLQADQQGV